MQESSKLSIKQISSIPSLIFNQNSKIQSIAFSHGPFVIFDNNTKSFDLRPFEFNPIFGHENPVLRRSYKYQDYKSLKESLNSDELHFFNRIYESSLKIPKMLKILKKDLPLIGDLPVIQFTYLLNTKKLSENGLFICDENLFDNKTTLYINFALDDELLIDLIERIKKCL